MGFLDTGWDEDQEKVIKTKILGETEKNISLNRIPEETYRTRFLGEP